MYKEDKKRKIINYLLNNFSYTPARELADLLATSSKSIYRLIYEINETKETKCILSERGKGFYLNPKFDSSEILGEKLSNNVELAISPTERRNEIIKDLLINSPFSVSVNHLVNKFFISESMLSVDEKHILSTLNKFNLQLIRKDRTLTILGEESNIRMALMESIDMLNIDVEKTESIPTNLEKRDMNFVNKQINIIEKTLNVSIPYPYNINIVSHLYILILRIRKHGKLSDEGIKSFDFPNNSINQSYLRVCDIVIQNFESYLSAKLPNVEKEYLYKYLTSYRIEYANDIENNRNINFSNEIEVLADSIIKMMEENLFHEFDNTQFRIDLMKHLKPMTNRLKNNIFIKNKLLEQIKFEYPKVHTQTINVSRSMMPSISEDEIGFLTLYFAREIERNPRKMKTLITCTTGIGTSELLRVKIEKIIPEIEIVDVISTDVIDNQVIKDIDLIVSTVAIKNFNIKPVIVVSAMFNKNDQEKLKNFIQKSGVKYE